MSDVVMRHPNLPEDQTITIPEDAVPGHEASGWQLVEVDDDQGDGHDDLNPPNGGEDEISDLTLDLSTAPPHTGQAGPDSPTRGELP